MVGCGRFGTIVWECVGNVFGEVNLKILHIVAKIVLVIFNRKKMVILYNIRGCDLCVAMILY